MAPPPAEPAPAPERRCAGLRLWLAASLPLRVLFGWLDHRALFAAWRCPAGLLRAPAGAEGAAAAASANGTGLELIIASAGNSGSTSLHAALEALGVRTFGPEELALYTPELPLDSLGSVDWAGPGSPLRACGATGLAADLLTMPLAWELLPRSPSAKVLLLTRDWRSWASSKRKMGARGPLSQLVVRLTSLALFCHWLPHGLLWPRAGVGASFMREGGGLTMELLDHCLLPLRALEAAWGGRQAQHLAWLRRTTARLLASEAAYREFQEKVRAMVPPDRLLEADVASLGWEQLASFAGRPLGAASGPLPRAKVGGFGKIVARMALRPGKHLALLGLALASAAANWLAFRAALRAWGRCRLRGGGLPCCRRKRE